MQINKTSFAFKLAEKVNKVDTNEKWTARDGVEAFGCSLVLGVDHARINTYSDAKWLCDFE